MSNSNTGSKRSKGSLAIPATSIHQAGRESYLFAMGASELWRLVQINPRSDDKREGYQRALSNSRVRSVARYIHGGGLIPGAIVVSLDAGFYDAERRELLIPRTPSIGWVIDGQHRLAGAFEAAESGVDTNLAVIAFLKAPIEEQSGGEMTLQPVFCFLCGSTCREGQLERSWRWTTGTHSGQTRKWQRVALSVAWHVSSMLSARQPPELLSSESGSIPFYRIGDPPRVYPTCAKGM